MSIEALQPDGHIEQPGVGLVLFNHLGSTVSQDTGRDARFIANKFGIPVVAADRPGTHGLVPNAKLADKMSTIDGYTDEILKIGQSINSHLDELEISSTIVVGRSAAGLGALALTACRAITSQRALFVAEPVGCETMLVEEAKKRVKEYGSYQKHLQETDPTIIKPVGDNLPIGEKLSRLGHMVLDYNFDVFHNKYIWATNTSARYASDVAKNIPNIDTTIEFAEHSLTAEPSVYMSMLDIPSDRNQVDEPFVVDRSWHTSHASYDNRDFMCVRLQPTIQRVLANA